MKLLGSLLCKLGIHDWEMVGMEGSKGKKTGIYICMACFKRMEKTI